MCLLAYQFQPLGTERSRSVYCLAYWILPWIDRSFLFWLQLWPSKTRRALLHVYVCIFPLLFFPILLLLLSYYICKSYLPKSLEVIVRSAGGRRCRWYRWRGEDILLLCQWGSVMLSPTILIPEENPETALLPRAVIWQAFVGWTFVAVRKCSNEFSLSLSLFSVSST